MHQLITKWIAGIGKNHWNQQVQWGSNTRQTRSNNHTQVVNNRPPPFPIWTLIAIETESEPARNICCDPPQHRVLLQKSWTRKLIHRTWWTFTTDRFILSFAFCFLPNKSVKTGGLYPVFFCLIEQKTRNLKRKWTHYRFSVVVWELTNIW